MVLDAIEEPVTRRLFYSRRLGTQVPGYGIYAERVQDVLREYADRSDGKVILEVYDPMPFTPVADRAVSYGLQQIPPEPGEGPAVFGLTGRHATAEHKTIPFPPPDRHTSQENHL